MNFIRLLAFVVNLLVVFAGAVAFFDSFRRPAQAFDIVGRGSRTVWLVGLALGTFVAFWWGMLSMFGLISTIAIIVYHVDQKVRLNEITN